MRLSSSHLANKRRQKLLQEQGNAEITSPNNTSEVGKDAS